MPDMNAVKALANQNRSLPVDALEVKTVSARERTRRACGGPATHLEGRLYTLHRASKKSA